MLKVPRFERAAIAAVAAVFTLVAACSPTAGGQNEASSSPKPGGHIVIAIVGDPGTLNPLKDGGIADNYVSELVRDRLVCSGQDGGVVPCLATSWDTSNPLAIVFHLRHNVVFSNGAPFTAADAKYSFDNLALGNNSDFQGSEGPIKSTKVIDDYTFEVDLSQPDPYFLEYQSLNSDVGIIPKGWLEHCAPNCDTTVVGTGPFTVKEWVKGDHLTLERNPKYWDSPRPYLNEIEFKVTKDPEAQVLQLKAGAADILFAVPFKDLAGLSKTSGISVDKHGSGSLTEIILNNRVAPFNNLQVRQAMEYAINRKQIGDVAMFGYADPATDILPPWHWGHDSSYPAPAYDPNKAKQLLASAGFDSNHPLSFELRIINNSDFVDEATIIQQQLSQIGVTIKVTPLDKATFLAPMFYTPGADNLSWQAGLERYTFGGDTPSIVYQTYDTGSYINFGGVNLPHGVMDPTLQGYIDQAKTEGDKTKAKAIFLNISKQVDMDALTVRLPWQNNVMASRNRVQNFHVLAAFEYPLQYVWVNDGK